MCWSVGSVAICAEAVTRSLTLLSQDPAISIFVAVDIVPLTDIDDTASDGWLGNVTSASWEFLFTAAIPVQVGNQFAGCVCKLWYLHNLRSLTSCDLFENSQRLPSYLCLAGLQAQLSHILDVVMVAMLKWHLMCWSTIYYATLLFPKFFLNIPWRYLMTMTMSCLKQIGHTEIWRKKAYDFSVDWHMIFLSVINKFFYRVFYLTIPKKRKKWGFVDIIKKPYN